MTNKNTPFGFRPHGTIYPPNVYISNGAISALDSVILAAGTVTRGLATSGSLCGVAATPATGAGEAVLVYDHPEQLFVALCNNSATTGIPGTLCDMIATTGAQRIDDGAVGFRTWIIVHHIATTDQPDVGANGAVICKIAKHQMQGGGDIRHTSDPYASPAGDINIGVGNFTITALTGNFHSEGDGTIGPVAAPTITLPASGAIQIGVAAAEDLEIVPGTTFTLGVTATPCVSTVLTPGATYGDTNIVGDLMLGPIAGPLMDLGIDGAIRCGLVGAPTFTVSATGAVHAEGDLTLGPVAAPSLDYDVATGVLTVGVAAAEGLTVIPGTGLMMGIFGAGAWQIDLTAGVNYGNVLHNLGNYTLTAGDLTVTAGNLEITAGALNLGAAGAGLSISAAGLITASAGMITAPAGTHAVTNPGATDAPGGVAIGFVEWLEITTPGGASFIPVYR